MLEFLGLDERSRYSESELESAIIGQIESFLLEMGKGFLFGVSWYGRSTRIWPKTRLSPTFPPLLPSASAPPWHPALIAWKRFGGRCPRRGRLSKDSAEVVHRRRMVAARRAP